MGTKENRKQTPASVTLLTIWKLKKMVNIYVSQDEHKGQAWELNDETKKGLRPKVNYKQVITY